MSRIPHRGFTLLEVLIALLVFSMGLIGLAGLLAVSVQTNHSAYLRTQANFLAQGMADRMHANTLGLWNNSYNMALATIPTGTMYPSPSTCGSGSTCGYAAIAARDLQAWQSQLVAFLPAPQAMINCVPSGAAPTANLWKMPPYSGTCEIEIKWSESTLNNSTAANSETFDWVFQP